MHCDLNIPCPKQFDRSTVDRLKFIASRLTQYNDCTIAFNYTLDAASVKSTIKKPNTELFDISVLNTEYELKILTRVTLDINEPVELNVFSELRSSFDLIAIRTNNLQVFKEACQSYPVDIISLSCTERLTFELHPTDIQHALDRHVFFEVCYAPAIRDNQSRIFTLQLVKQLFEYTKGSHVIISSEAEIVSEIRQPADIFYFAKSIGFPNDKAQFVTEKHCLQLLNLVNKK